MEQSTKQKRRRIPARTRERVLRWYGYRCQLCGATFEDGIALEIDHRVPVAHGGTNDVVNLWVLCRPCNRKKSDSPWAPTPHS